jgi:ABC-type uncharacterized transport system permease subunit
MRPTSEEPRADSERASVIRKIFEIWPPFLAAALGLALGLTVTWIAGESPMHVLHILAKGAFGSSYDLGMTLFYATPLMFTGLSVALAFQAGLFNIGAEGQLTLGALAAAAVGPLCPRLPWPVAAPLAVLAAVAAGTVWGAIPGWLRARRGSHEVINTIMLNFIASGLASYATLNLIGNPESQNPETKPIGPGYLILQFGAFGGAPVSAALPLALITAIAVHLLLSKTTLGFELRAVGQNEAAARTSGIDVGRIRILALSMAGGLAGLVAVNEVLGNVGKFRLGFSAEYGFTGIAVALLARNHPLGVLPTALLFGALHKGTTDLDLETEHVTREVSLIFQALITLSVSAEGLWTWIGRRSYRAEPAQPQSHNSD